MTCLRLNIWVFDNILADAKSCHKIFVYDIPYKTLISVKPLRIRPYKINRFIRVFDGNKYLVLFGLEKIWRHLRQD